MAKKQTYPPIEVIKNFEKANVGIYEVYDGIRKERGESEAEFDSAVNVSNTYYNPSVQSNQSKICSVMLYVTGAWRHNKKTVKFSKKLTKKFFYPNKLELHDPSIFRQLPFDPLYIEVEGIDSIHGMFIRYSEDMCLVVTVVYNSGKVVYNIFRTKFWLTLNEQIEDFAVKFKDENERMNITKAMIFALQAATYMCYHKGDIAENEEQKHIFKPTDHVQDRYSEVQIFDVGREFDKKMRKTELRMMLKKYKDYVIRCAHWHKIGNQLRFLPDLPMRKR
ncbi:MAG: hypothetical protein IKF52_06500 [Clostridia bacterium]|nr:hypothetical protein [Clostridia bacterium]